jgi:hypothetical protein
VTRSKPDARSTFGRQHEEGLVFLIEPRERARFREELKKVAAGRTWTVPQQRWDARYTYDARGFSADGIERKLRSKGAPDSCWLIMNMRRGEEVPLHVGIEWLFHPASYRSLVSCIPGQLAYYDDCDHHEYLILERPAVA